MSDLPTPKIGETYLHVVPEPDQCPACHGENLGVFAASTYREDEADLWECHSCGLSMPLTAEGLKVLDNALKIPTDEYGFAWITNDADGVRRTYRIDGMPAEDTPGAFGVWVDDQPAGHIRVVMDEYTAEHWSGEHLYAEQFDTLSSAMIGLAQNARRKDLPEPQPTVLAQFRVNGCTVFVERVRTDDGHEGFQLRGNGCNLTGEEPGLYFPEPLTA